MEKTLHFISAFFLAHSHSESSFSSAVRLSGSDRPPSTTSETAFF